MRFNPTPKFVELVSRVHDPKQDLCDLSYSIPTSKEDLWAEFLFPLFMGGNRRGAQVAYAEKTLRDHLSFGQAVLASSDQSWSKNIVAKIDLTIKKLGKAPPDGLKRSILEDVRSEIANLDLVNTLAGMSQFVDSLDPKVLSNIRGDFDQEFNFVDASVGSGSLPNVGYTKFVLWMQGLNTAWTLTAPSGPVRWALSSRELGYTGTNPFKWGEDRAANEMGIQARTEFGGLSACYRTLCSELIPLIGSDLTPMETQSAAWVLGTTHGLLPAQAHARNRLSSKSLLEYVDAQGLTIGQFVDRVLDLDRAGRVQQDLLARL